MDREEQMIGVVVSKLEPHGHGQMRGYIAMLAVKDGHRGKGIATTLVRMAIDAMIAGDADEASTARKRVDSRRLLIFLQVALETEVTNTAAMKLYERLGFLRSKRLHRYYLNGNTAFRFLLYLKEAAVTGRSDEGTPDFSQAPQPPYP